MHHKFMVVDGEIIVTGSYNWSTAAEDRNDENFVVIRDRSVAERFIQEFNRLLSIARP
jgi:phosphatidylserine/phosphatidylglycerophosphate/cardiolipin synthase-like enzyme